MVFIFDSHPVQYKAPVYQRMQTLGPDLFRVIYVTDCSLRGYRDQEFGQMVTWDTPLLAGYQSQILNNERGVPLRGFRSLTGRGVYQLFKKERPRAVIISQFIYEADLVAYFSCLLLGIPIWIRQETQDEAFQRPLWKQILRGMLYRAAYRAVQHAFYIGELNFEHLRRHGISGARMSRTPYCTLSPASAMTNETKGQHRRAMRRELGIAPGEILVLFSGKLIEKKNPELILEAIKRMASQESGRPKVVFVGSGELAESLRAMASTLEGRVHFAGFVNQSKITDYYLAADILVLPSRRAGETWGLVVNEALQAGCAVVMTDAVGCHREFGDWERIRVIPDGDADACAQAIRELSQIPHSFEWCAARMERYSVNAVADAIIQQIKAVEMPSKVTPRDLARQQGA